MAIIVVTVVVVGVTVPVAVVVPRVFVPENPACGEIIGNVNVSRCEVRGTSTDWS